jgi:hypothetical protein
LFTETFEATGSSVADSKLFMKINSTKDATLRSISSEMQSGSNSELCLTTDILSELLNNIRSKLVAGYQGEEIPTVDESVLGKAAARPSKKTLTQICREVREEVN